MNANNNSKSATTKQMFEYYYSLGISQEKIEKIKDVYKIDTEFTKNYVSKRFSISKENILELLSQGLDLNFVYIIEKNPVYLYCEDLIALEVCKHFGADLNLTSKKQAKKLNSGNYILAPQLDRIPLVMFDTFKDYILALPQKAFQYISDVNKLIWLNNHNFSFNPKVEGVSGIWDLLKWTALEWCDKNGHLQHQDAANYILNETDFDFNSEYEVSIYDWGTYRLKLWQIYVAEVNDADISGLKNFVSNFKNRIDFSDVSSDGNSVFIALCAKNISRKAIEIFLEFNVDPHKKNKDNLSFYDILSKTKSKYKNQIAGIDEWSMKKDASITSTYSQNQFGKIDRFDNCLKVDAENKTTPRRQRSVSTSRVSATVNDKDADEKLTRNQQKLNFTRIRNLFEKHSVFDEIDCDDDFELIEKMEASLQPKGVRNLLEMIKFLLIEDDYKSLVKDVEDYLQGNDLEDVSKQ